MNISRTKFSLDKARTYHLAKKKWTQGFKGFLDKWTARKGDMLQK